MGDREKNLRRAIAAIGRSFDLLDASSVYETEPMYFEDQGRFLNCVVAVETDLAPAELLAWLKAAEGQMGRKEGPRNAPRPIDMDILLYGTSVLAGPSLEIPHPRMQERAFVLVPLAEIRPNFVHPVLGKTAGRLLKELGDHKQVVKRLDLFERLPPSRPRRRAPHGVSPTRRGFSPVQPRSSRPRQ